MSRFRWFSVAFGVLAVWFMYNNACWTASGGWGVMHPVLTAITVASVAVCLCGMSAAAKSGHGNLVLMSLFSYAFGVMGPFALMDPHNKVAYTFPSGGDYFLACVVVFNFALTALMVFARVPKGKMLIVNNRAYYGGETPVFLPWMKYNVEKLDEIPVKVEFHCAAGTSVVCEAMLAPDVAWCGTNGVFTVNTARVKAIAAEIVTRIIHNRTATLDTSWMCLGEVLDAIASVDIATINGVAEGVSFRCLRFTVTAATAKTSSDEAKTAA